MDYFDVQLFVGERRKTFCLFTWLNWQIWSDLILFHTQSYPHFVLYVFHECDSFTFVILLMILDDAFELSVEGQIFPVNLLALFPIVLEPNLKRVFIDCMTDHDFALFFELNRNVSIVKHNHSLVHVPAQSYCFLSQFKIILFPPILMEDMPPISFFELVSDLDPATIDWFQNGFQRGTVWNIDRFLPLFSSPHHKVENPFWNDVHWVLYSHLLPFFPFLFKKNDIFFLQFPLTSLRFLFSCPRSWFLFYVFVAGPRNFRLLIRIITLVHSVCKQSVFFKQKSKQVVSKLAGLIWSEAIGKLVIIQKESLIKSKEIIFQIPVFFGWSMCTLKR